MDHFVQSRIALISLLLVAATGFSWSAGHGVGVPDAQIAGVVILVVAFVKVRMVMFEFMELRDAPTWMRRSADGWILEIATLLVLRFVITI
ncbi:cytochrome C oxidase subunit IV family protein [Mycobacterium sp. OTB74]|jgi:hypothetical protein|uniref:cytochrome C oxidase subunit IV family protein n=1 Tax=Mycobacterium sp. OTB74 TaxID=1853452 RepID=UPI00247332DC|nr:cytochrome C oxidase subunit IV family protein [Mycobacterium sp. OTB74]MDH6245080.1 hypothetical protein [Mycobacterium sp. OTB74]